MGIASFLLTLYCKRGEWASVLKERVAFTQRGTEETQSCTERGMKEAPLSSFSLRASVSPLCGSV